MIEKILSDVFIFSGDLEWVEQLKLTLKLESKLFVQDGCWKAFGFPVFTNDQTLEFLLESFISLAENILAPFGGFSF